MTEPTPTTRPSEGKDDGISKYMKRMKTVLKGGTRSNRASVSSLSEIMGGSSKPAAKPGATSESAKADPSKKTTKKTTTITGSERAQHWADVQEARARALFEKYGLTLEPNEWTNRPVNRDVERVNKPVRMRVRRNCHRCAASFGADKICPGCQHLRCKKCFRYPPPKPKDAPRKDNAKVEPEAKRAKVVLTMPSRTGGQDLVRKQVHQVVRRNCHECDTLFVGSATECAQCHHIRCKKCPRDPPKLRKYPDGYPGDAEPPYQRPERVYRKPRRRVRWTCDSCNQLFTHGEKTCHHCQHERCKSCIRDPPKKIKPEPDPELLRRVEEKLAKIDVSS